METLKFAGGAIIVLTAAIIMLPGAFTYIAGLWRLFALIAVALGLALGVTLISRRLVKLSKKS